MAKSTARRKSPRRKTTTARRSAARKTPARKTTTRKGPTRRTRKSARKAPRKATTARRKRPAKSNPIGEMATLLFANPSGGSMAKTKRAPARRPAKARRRKRSTSAMTTTSTRATTRKRTAPKRRVVPKRPRKARKNPSSATTELLIGAAGVTTGVLAGRYVQNASALKMGTQQKSQASKPLHIALGAAVPVALGVALNKLTKQRKFANGLIQGGIVLGIHELLRSLVFSKAEPGSAFYPLSGTDEQDDALNVAQAADGSQWVNVPGQGWLPIDTEPGMAGLQVQDELGGLQVQDDLGGLQMQDELGNSDFTGDFTDDFDGLQMQDALDNPGEDFDF